MGQIITTLEIKFEKYSSLVSTVVKDDFLGSDLPKNKNTSVFLLLS